MLTESESFIDQHRIYQQLEKEPFEVFRKVLIKSDYFRTYCDIDSKKLYEKNKYGASKSYDTALEYYLHLKEIAPLRKTEIDLLPIWDGNEY